MTELDKSYDYCRTVARSRARNFYYSFVLLPKPQRKAMCAVYAFMRYCDDLSDDPAAGPEQARASIGRWSADLDLALAGRAPDHPVWLAFRDTVERYKIPHEYFHEMIAGVTSDLEPRRIATFEELYRYCYQVASVVGLTVIHIFGYRGDQALPLAEKCGVAFQLTNILRDVREDAERDRVYLPAEDLERHHVAPEDFRAGRSSEAFVELMRFEASRARAYYNESAPLVDMVDPHSRPSLWALIEIYSGLLAAIERRNYDVLSGRVSLPARKKLWIVLKASVGSR
jgi:15-cis-phytoene synthase